MRKIRKRWLKAVEKIRDRITAYLWNNGIEPLKVKHITISRKPLAFKERAGEIDCVQLGVRCPKLKGTPELYYFPHYIKIVDIKDVLDRNRQKQ
jgi:hypothetical protein